MKKKWLHVIRRDEGKHFKVNEHTKICSQQLKEGGIKKSLACKNELRDGVVPSVFPWIRTSPCKRKEPAERNFELTALKNASQTLSSPAVVVEELSNKLSNELSNESSNEIVPHLLDFRIKSSDIKT